MALFMFPEGTRSKDARLRPSFSGSALIALHNSVPILPVGITGLENLGKGLIWCLFHRPRVTVNIGCPFYLKHVDGKLSRKQLAELAGDIMEHIAELLPPRYQGYYAGRVDSNGTED
jgi:1-acyl-sn-glycerol-3-phosphate acyltransferase